MYMPRTLGVMRVTLAWVICLALFTGCATTVPQRAQSLASSGMQVASVGNETLIGVSSDVKRTIEGNAVAKSLGGTVVELGSTEVDRVKRIAKKIEYRAKVLSSLQRAYSAYSALAVYDARGEFEAALGDLTTSINQLAGTINPATPLFSKPVSGIITRTGGLLAQRAQKRALQQGSMEIRARLEFLLGILKEDEPAFDAAVDFAINEQRLVATTLQEQGFSSASAIVQEHAERFGLVFDPKAYNAMVTNLRKKDDVALKQHLDDIADVVKLRASQYVETQKGILAQQIAAIENLIRQHKLLEANEKLKPEQLQANIAILQAYADDLATIRAERRARALAEKQEKLEEQRKTIETVIKLLQAHGKLPTVSP